jgi:hypothetical protein
LFPALRLYSRLGTCHLAGKSDALKDPFTMARRKKQRKRTWRTLLLFVLVPLTVWFGAFLLWLYWYDLNNWFMPDSARRAGPEPARQIEPNDHRGRSPVPAPQEKLFEEDRQKLEDILKRRG